jgi:hypothetical protein
MSARRKPRPWITPAEFAAQEDISYSATVTMCRAAPPGTVARSPLGRWRIMPEAAGYLRALIADKERRRLHPGDRAGAPTDAG